jgi:hypothetical protein
MSFDSRRSVCEQVPHVPPKFYFLLHGCLHLVISGQVSGIYSWRPISIGAVPRNWDCLKANRSSTCAGIQDKWGASISKQHINTVASGNWKSMSTKKKIRVCIHLGRDLGSLSDHPSLWGAGFFFLAAKYGGRTSGWWLVANTPTRGSPSVFCSHKKEPWWGCSYSMF